MLYSFDVFDTLITRTTATPEGVFALMQERLKDEKYNSLGKFIRQNFYELRIGAEQVARNTCCGGEIDDVTLEQIYNVLVRQGHIGKISAKRLQALEQEVELGVVRGIRENIDKVKAHLEAGDRVVLISDMYLEPVFLRKMLVKADPVFDELPLYASSEIKKGKWTGKLFRFVQEKEEIPYEEWHHTGDNIHSDIEVPKHMGIKCERYQLKQFLDIEKEYLKNNEYNALVQLTLGAARLARMAGGNSEAYQLGCTVGGGVLYPYVRWILEDCFRLGIKRLYFVARDGFVLKELTDCLIRQNGYPIETKYIYGSRIAWRIPEGDNIREEMLEIYRHSYRNKIFNINDLADLFQLPVTMLDRYVPEKLKTMSKVWHMSTVDWLMGQLLQTEEFVILLCESLNRRRKLVVSYLRQEVDVSDDRFAFVDLAGSGLTQECLANIMRTYYSGRVLNYFFRMDEVRSGVCYNKVFYPNFVPYYIMLEMMCRAPHGQTMGYSEEGEKIVPIFSQTDGDAIIYHGVPQFIEGVKQFGIIYDRAVRESKVMLPELNRIQFYLRYIYESPDKLVLDYFGDMPDMLTGREKNLVFYAPKLTNRDIRNIYWYCKETPIDYFYRGGDLNYSLKRCTERQRKRILYYQRQRDSRWGKVCRKLRESGIRRSVALGTTTMYDCIAQKIVVYGAGKKGQLFYRQITGTVKVGKERYQSEVVLWVDKNYEEYQKQGLMVSAPRELKGAEYEQIVIAIAKRETVEQVKKELMECGIEERYIFEMW